MFTLGMKSYTLFLFLSQVDLSHFLSLSLSQSHRSLFYTHTHTHTHTHTNTSIIIFMSFQKMIPPPDTDEGKHKLTTPTVCNTSKTDGYRLVGRFTSKCPMITKVERVSGKHTEEWTERRKETDWKKRRNTIKMTERRIVLSCLLNPATCHVYLS